MKTNDSGGDFNINNSNESEKRDNLEKENGQMIL
jgi:hypothetical protein